jgi:hypothetical protein
MGDGNLPRDPTGGSLQLKEANLPWNHPQHVKSVAKRKRRAQEENFSDVSLIFSFISTEFPATSSCFHLASYKRVYLPGTGHVASTSGPKQQNRKAC